VLDWCRAQGISRLILWSDTRFDQSHRLYIREGSGGQASEACRGTSTRPENTASSAKCDARFLDPASDTPGEGQLVDRQVHHRVRLCSRIIRARTLGERCHARNVLRP
jgi:hypothetical protein